MIAVRTRSSNRRTVSGSARDGCRVPMPWTDDPSTAYGFSGVGADESAPRAMAFRSRRGGGTHAVDELDSGEHSILELYRAATEARTEFATPQGLVAAIVDLGDGVVAVRRGELVAVTNTTDAPIALDMDDDLIEIATPVFASEPTEMHTPRCHPARLHDLVRQLTHGRLGCRHGAARTLRRCRILGSTRGSSRSPSPSSGRSDDCRSRSTVR